MLSKIFNSLILKTFIAVLLMLIAALFYLKFSDSPSHPELSTADSIGADIAPQEKENALKAGLVSSVNEEKNETADSVFLYFLSENNFVQVMRGEDDMPVLSFSLPEAEPISEQQLTEHRLTINYSVGSSSTMIRRFEFKMETGNCDSGSPVYKEWRKQTFSNISFTRGTGRQTDVAPHQSKLYSFRRWGHCFAFEVVFPATTDNATAQPFNEAEEINFIEGVLNSIKIY